MTSSHLIELNDSTFSETTARGFVVVDFWAPWCGPCRALTPVLEEVAATLAGKAVVAKLNVDENPGTAARYTIRSIPTMLIFKEGTLVEQLVGLQSRDSLLAALERHGLQTA